MIVKNKITFFEIKKCDWCKAKRKKLYECVFNNVNMSVYYCKKCAKVV